MATLQAVFRATADFKQVTSEARGAGTALRRMGDDAESASGRASVSAGKTEKSVGMLGKVAEHAGAIFAGAFAADKVKDFAFDAVNSFSELEDTTAAAGVIFGKNMDMIEKQSMDAAKTMGMSRSQVIDAANTFGTYGKSAGLSGKALAQFSVQMTQTAGDMSSFKGGSPEEAILAVGSALRGEMEPIRRYGVLLDDASLKAQAASMGLLKTKGSTDQIKLAQLQAMDAQKKYNAATAKYGKGSKQALTASVALSGAQDKLKKATQGVTGTLTPQQKVLAAQALILKQTKDAQGDFARTQDSTANVAKTTSAQYENMKAVLGEQLAPAFTAARKVAGDIFGKIAEEAPKVIGWIKLAAQWVDKYRIPLEAVGILLAVVFVPGWIAAGIAAVISAAQQGAAWVATSAKASWAAARTIVNAAIIVGRWVWMAVSATANALRMAAAWTIGVVWGAIKAVASMIWASISIVAKWIWMAATAVGRAVWMATSWTIGIIAPAARAVGAMIATAARVVAQWAVMAAGALMQAARMALAWTIGIVRGAAQALASLAIAAARVVAQWAIMAAGSLLQAGRMALAWFIGFVQGAIPAMASFAATVLRVVAGWVMMGVQAMWNAIRMAAAWIIAMGPIGWVIIAVIALVALIIANWGRVKQITVAVWGAISRFLSMLWNGIKAAAMAIWNALVFWYVGIPLRIFAALGRLGQLAGMAARWFGGFVMSAIRKGGEILSWASGLPGRVIGALGNIAGMLIHSGASLIEGFLSGMKGAWDNVIGWASGAMDKLRGLWPFSPAKWGPFSGHGYVTYSGEAISSDFADSLRKGGPGIGSAAVDMLSHAKKAVSDFGAGAPSARSMLAVNPKAIAPVNTSVAPRANPAAAKSTLQATPLVGELHVHNPVPERATDSLHRQTQKIAYLGLAGAK